MRDYGDVGAHLAGIKFIFCYKCLHKKDTSEGKDERSRIQVMITQLPTAVGYQTDYVETISTAYQLQTDNDFTNDYTRLKSENEILKNEKECCSMKLAMVEETMLSCDHLKTMTIYRNFIQAFSC